MENMFEVNSLEFKYPSSKENIIKGISFDINKGEIFGLLGRSGAGKSTVQKILIRLLTDYGGEISFCGKDLREYKNPFYEDIGVGFEMPVHFNKLTGLENMRYFAKLYKNSADVEGLFTRLNLYEYRNRLVGEYSKGMKVRLNFIRCMLNNPKMIFLDEITNGLDPQNARTVKDMIKEFRDNGGTVFLTTHLMNDVEELCDRVAFISDGKIAELSSPRDLKLKYGKKTVNVEYRENGELKLAEFELYNIGENEAFSAILKSGTVETIHSGETTLDEIFIKVVNEGKNAAGGIFKEQ